MGMRAGGRRCPIGQVAIATAGRASRLMKAADKSRRLYRQLQPI